MCQSRIKVFVYLQKQPVLFTLVIIATVIWFFVLYKVFVDEVNLIGREIGAAIAK